MVAIGVPLQLPKRVAQFTVPKELIMNLHRQQSTVVNMRPADLCLQRYRNVLPVIPLVLRPLFVFFGKTCHFLCRRRS